MSYLKPAHIITSIFAAFVVTVSISAFLASLTQNAETRYGAPASLIDGIFGKNTSVTSISALKTTCSNNTYGACPRENACVKNPIGDYYCANIRQAVCPAGTECAPCSQTQLEQCIKNNPRASSCVVAKNISGSTTLCSHE